MNRSNCSERLMVTGAVLASVSFAKAQTQGPYQFYAVTPCRIVDTRNSGRNGRTGGPILQGGHTATCRHGTLRCSNRREGRGAERHDRLAHRWGSPHHLPYATPQPIVSTLNWAAGEPAIANGAIVPLSAKPSFSITVFGGLSGGRRLT